MQDRPKSPLRGGQCAAQRPPLANLTSRAAVPNRGTNILKNWWLASAPRLQGYQRAIIRRAFPARAGSRTRIGVHRNESASCSRCSDFVDSWRFSRRMDVGGALPTLLRCARPICGCRQSSWAWQEPRARPLPTSAAERLFVGRTPRDRRICGAAHHTGAFARGFAGSTSPWAGRYPCARDAGSVASGRPDVSGALAICDQTTHVVGHGQRDAWLSGRPRNPPGRRKNISSFRNTSRPKKPAAMCR